MKKREWKALCGRQGAEIHAMQQRIADLTEKCRATEQERTCWEVSARDLRKRVDAAETANKTLKGQLKQALRERDIRKEGENA